MNQAEDMFERFSAHARRAVVLAQEEAGRLNHNYIGTEHILLGLLRQPEGTAAAVLEDFGIPLDRARREVEAITGVGKKPVGKGHIPFTPRAKKVLELSLREAMRLGHNYIGTEHILLGLIREGDGVAAKVLAGHAADLKEIRAAVLERVPLGDQQATDPMVPVRRAFRDRLQERFGFGSARESGEAGDVAEPGIRATPAGDATLSEAIRLAGPQAVGSHHLLLAALADQNSAAALALISLGVNLDQIREKLREANVVGTSDEQPEEAGRRQLVIQVSDETLTLVATDPVLMAAGKAALAAVAAFPNPEAVEGAGEGTAGKSATATVIRGDHPAAASLAGVWLELRKSLEKIKDAATPPAAA